MFSSGLELVDTEARDLSSQSTSSSKRHVRQVTHKPGVIGRLRRGVTLFGRTLLPHLEPYPWPCSAETSTLVPALCLGV